MKAFYEFAAATPHQVEARHKDGRRAAQVRLAFLAPSSAAALRLMPSWSRTYLTAHVSIEEDFPNLPLDEYDPGTVIIAPLDPGDTIDGTKGWRPL